MAKGAAQLKVSPEVCFLQDCELLFKLLKKHGANFEAIDHGGNKPATLAAKAGRKKSKELLEEALVK